MSANPIGLVIAAVTALVAAFVYLWNNCEEFRNFWINLWEVIKSAAKSAWEFLKKIINGIIDGLNKLIRGIVSAINTIIRGINSIKIDIPEWLGGGSIGFNIKELPLTQIPRLAQGAVIPPNKEFLAMLGDQKHGTNIEAPLDTIKQALAEVLAEVGGGGSREPIVLEVNGRTLAKVVWDEQEKRYKQTGKYAMA
jgi:hypothetical protein